MPSPPLDAPSSPSLFSLPSINEVFEDQSFPYPTTEDAAFWQAPAPIAIATNKLLEETPLNSTDEMIHLMEVWLRHLGWMWIAEYLAASWQDQSLNQLLFDQFYEGNRAVSVGGWAYLGSTIAHTFAAHQQRPQNLRLCAFAYGSITSQESHLSHLLRYRNSFAHSSFAAIMQDIMEHRKRLWELVAPLEHLHDTPIVFWDQEAALWRTASGHWQPYPHSLSLPPAPGAIWQITEGDPIDISHICEIKALSPKPVAVSQQAPTNDHSPRLQRWQLSYLSRHNAQRSQREKLFSQQPHTYEHFSRFVSMRQGLLDFRESFADEALPTMPPQEWQRILAQIQLALTKEPPDRPHILTLLGYPGSGKSSIVAQTSRLVPGLTHTILYRLNYQELTTSGVTCARYLIRSLASLWDMPQWTEALDRELELPEQLLNRLRYAEQHSSHQRLLLGFDQFHLAYEPYQNEPYSIYDLLSGLRGISGKYIAIALAARPGYREDLLGDEWITLPIAEYAKEETYEGLLHELGLEERESSRGLTPQEVAFRRTLLFLLGSAPHPLSPFALCEVFERLQRQMPSALAGLTIFTPHVERCLWELRPILRWERRHAQTKQQREEVVYAPFCEHFGRWLRETLFPQTDEDDQRQRILAW